MENAQSGINARHIRQYWKIDEKMEIIKNKCRYCGKITDKFPCVHCGEPWYWEEVSFIPYDVDAQDLLQFQGHIFIKSNVVKRLEANREFKRKETEKKENEYYEL